MIIVYIVAVFTGYLNISNDISFSLNTNLNYSNVEFTLNYTTSGGPATNVTWTSQTDHTLLPLESSVLVNAITAEYIHTLKVSGRKGGLYTSTVMNNKPSSISTSLLVKGKKCMSFNLHTSVFTQSDSFLLFQRLPHQQMYMLISVRIVILLLCHGQYQVVVIVLLDTNCIINMLTL